MRLMELYRNDFSAEIIHEYYANLKVKEWFTKGHTEETFKVAASDDALMVVWLRIDRL